MRDFTVKAYLELLSSLKEEKIDVYRVLEWVSERPAKGVILRYDVDRKVSRALKFAKLEVEKVVFNL